MPPRSYTDEMIAVAREEQRKTRVVDAGTKTGKALRRANARVGTPSSVQPRTGNLAGMGIGFGGPLAPRLGRAALAYDTVLAVPRNLGRQFS